MSPSITILSLGSCSFPLVNYATRFSCLLELELCALLLPSTCLFIILRASACLSCDVRTSTDLVYLPQNIVSRCIPRPPAPHWHTCRAVSTLHLSSAPATPSVLLAAVLPARHVFIRVPSGVQPSWPFHLLYSLHAYSARSSIYRPSRTLFLRVSVVHTLMSSAAVVEDMFGARRSARVQFGPC